MMVTLNEEFSRTERGGGLATANPPADSNSALQICGRQHTQMIVIPERVLPPPPQLIFRLLFLRVQDIMQRDRGFLWGRRHLMYVAVITTYYWPRPGAIVAHVLRVDKSKRGRRG